MIYRFLIYIINFIQCFIIVYSFCVYSSLSNACGQPVQTFPNDFNHQVLLAFGCDSGIRSHMFRDEFLTCWNVFKPLSRFPAITGHLIQNSNCTCLSKMFHVFFPLLSHVQPSPGPFCSAWVDRYGTRTTTATLEIARIWVYADVVRCYLCSRSVGRLGFAYHLWFKHNFTAPKARFQWLYK